MIEAPLFALKLVGLWLLLTVAASLVAAGAYPAYRRQLAALAPGRRSLLRLVYGLMPVIASSLVVLLMTRPSLAGFIVPEHCHADECGAHAPVLGGATLASAGFAAFGALGGFLLLGAVTWLLRRAVGRLRMVQRLTRFAAQTDDYRVVDIEGFFACCVGLLRPEVLVSRGVLETLPGPQLEAVLAHERAHAGRRDNLRGFLAHAVTRIWPLPARQRFRQDLSADAEQACDAQAAAATGDAGAVIDALSALTLAEPEMPLSRGLAFGEGDTTARVDSLKAVEDANPRGVVAILTLGVFWILLVGFLTAVSHAFMEWLTVAGF